MLPAIVSALRRRTCLSLLLPLSFIHSSRLRLSASNMAFNSEEHNTSHHPDNEHGYLHRAPYVKERSDFVTKYHGSCFCGAVTFDVADDPVGA